MKLIITHEPKQAVGFLRDKQKQYMLCPKAENMCRVRVLFLTIWDEAYISKSL